MFWRCARIDPGLKPIAVERAPVTSNSRLDTANATAGVQPRRIGEGHSLGALLPAERTPFCLGDVDSGDGPRSQRDRGLHLHPELAEALLDQRVVDRALMPGSTHGRERLRV